MPNLQILKIIALIAVIAVAHQRQAAAQSDESAQATAGSPTYSESRPVFFEFGLKITSGGDSKGILGTVPIPIDWPEQSITFVAKNKTDNLKKLSFKNLNKEVRQMILKSNRLTGGEIAQGTVIIRADKRDIKKPVDTSQFKFAKSFPSRVRQYLKPSPFIESNDKAIKKLASTIKMDDNLTAWEQVETIYKWVREKIEYKFDTKIHSCMHALETGYGDCEELSSVFIAICRCKGIPARAVWIPSHTYPEFYLVDENGAGHWFPCQAAGSYQFGEMNESRPILQKGDRFKLPGSRKPLRYVQPTLVAKEAPGGISIEFINREITDTAQIEQLLSGEK